MERLISKIVIEGNLRAETGLHIGGSKTALDIGGIDNPVIKTKAGIPYVPGSSFKGKLRSLLAREYGSDKVENDEPIIKEIFGESPSNNSDESPKKNLTRLYVRDAYMSDESSIETDEDAEGDKYTEAKWENIVDRKKGSALNPRQMERVPAGAIFKFELIYNVFDDGNKEKHLAEIQKALNLLQDDYLGGSGSRGYGKVVVEDVTANEKPIEYYKNKDESKIQKVEFSV